MELNELIELFNKNEEISANAEAFTLLHKCSQDTIEFMMDINTKFYKREELNKKLFEFWGLPYDETFTLFPPIYMDFGKNMHIGKHVFINMNCSFQDQGGIYIGDRTQIGHNVVIATINHPLEPEKRKGIFPKKVVIGENVWIGANVTILPGVTIGDNSIIGANSLVNKDVPANVVVVGSPAKIIKHI